MAYRRFVVGWLVSIGISGWCLVDAAVGVGRQADKPNVLIITVDDMNCDSVGVFGCALPATTPNMDRLAGRALRFEYAHVQVGNCMPSRNVMWSGRYPHNNRVEGFYQIKDPDYPVLCDLAKQAGYFTAIRHKVSHSTPYAPYAWDLDLDAPPDGTRPHMKEASTYGQSTRIAIEAAHLAGKPFCMLINISDPHKPFYSEVRQGKDPHVPSRIFTPEEVPIPGFLHDDSVIRAELARYYSSVRRADDAVGSVLEALEESGQADRTFVLFLSDHGMPLPFAKTQLYHHSTRTPLMIRWPGVTRDGGVDRTHMVSAVDFIPTLAEVMGFDPPAGLDGRSFADILRGGTQSGRDHVIKEYNENAGGIRNPMRAIETKEFLYIFNPWVDGERVMATATNGTDTFKRMQQLARHDPTIAARVERMRHRVLEELYDVVRDPDCLHNLIDDPRHAATADRLRAQLLSALEASRDPVADLLRHRDDAALRQAYMHRVQAEADARREAKRPARKANRK